MKKAILFLVLSSFMGLTAFSQNNTCNSANPFCSGTNYCFPAPYNSGTAESGPDYGCLGTQPNPTWFYFVVGRPGPIQLQMQSSINTDVDFICWGPFTGPPGNYCSQLDDTSLIVDCSYSTATVEYCDIPYAHAGSIYLLLITNYANVPQNTLLSQSNLSDSSGMTWCGSLTNVCVGDTLSLQSVIRDTSASFLWTFPNGDTSTMQDALVPNVDMSYDGYAWNQIVVDGETLQFQYIVHVSPAPIVNFGHLELPGQCDSFPNYSQYYDSVAWDFGDGNVSSEFSPEHCYATNGDYIVTLTAFGPCGTNSKTDTISVAIGIGENLSDAFTLYPNPVADHLIISLGQWEEQVNAEIYTIEGCLLERKESLTKTTTLDVSGFKKGVYILKLSSDQQNAFVKFIKM